MLRHALVFDNVTFAYDRMSAPVLSGASFAVPPGWTGVVGANGAGKSSVLKLAAGILLPDRGSIRSPGKAVYCEQRTDDVPAGLSDFLQATDGQAARLRAFLKIELNWDRKWTVMSHGERKRAQIALALWEEPDLLALDEPTNHIDQEARGQLFQALHAYHGVGLLVSHDRSLLDSLCRQCLFVEPGRIVLRPGNYTQGRAQADQEESTQRQQRDLLKERISNLEKKLARARFEAGRSGRKASKRALSARDHDGRAKVDRARITGRDAAVARRAGQLESSLHRQRELRDGISVRKQYTLGVRTEDEPSRRDTLFRMPGGTLSLGTARRLVYPDLTMFPTDRIALTGPNGSGKTSLIRLILTRLNVEPDRVVYLPQELDAGLASRTVEQVRRLPREDLGRVMTFVTRLGSDPDRLMETALPSPGEMRKVLLALGIASSPHLIILDEPTNHLDLPSIQCMEDALARCSCGLLLVSHDERFLEALATRRWRNEPCADDLDCVVLCL